MSTANKGEWSEIYAFFRILADGKLYPGDADLNKINDFFYPVISVIREELLGKRSFSIDSTNIILTDDINPNIIFPIQRFITEAKALLASIKISTGTFSVKTTEAFLLELGCTRIKADSKTKADIIIKIHDPRTSLQPILGFSIKSKLGAPSTLLNASAATNLIFQIKGVQFSQTEIGQINSINNSRKIRARVQMIYKKGGFFELKGFDNQIFKNNLILIDSLLPDILSNALIIFYKDEKVILEDISKQLTLINPLNYDQSLKHKFYDHKLKRFLSEVALGMTPNTTWSGVYNGTEGYIIVKENGDVVCYHIINRNLFEDYLLKDTKLETPSTGRHGFGEIYQENGELLFKLNLQIRFI